jgi:hypothetical protein
MGNGSLARSGERPRGLALEDLREQLRLRGVPLLRADDLSRPHEEAAPLDRSPLRDLPPGTLGEIVGPWSSGKTSLALAEVARLTRRGERAAVVDATGCIFPPALALLGARLERILILDAGATAERATWAAEQVLRSGVFALTVLIEPGRLPGSALRRLQLAAERAGSRGLVVRRWPNAEALASLRLRVEPLPPRERPGSVFAAPPRRCRLQIGSRGAAGAAPARWAEVALS